MLKQMLKSIVVSLLCAFPSAIFLTGLGALLNYYSFKKREELLFYKTIYGGEWIGQSGFGWLQNHVYPFVWEGEVINRGDTIWLEFSKASLIDSFFQMFKIAFVVFLVFFACRAFWKYRKERAAEQAEIKADSSEPDEPKEE